MQPHRMSGEFARSANALLKSTASTMP